MTDETPPEIKHSLTELPRAAAEIYKLIWQFRGLIKNAPRGNCEPVLCISGYGGGDSSMAPLRQFLKSIGYTPHKAEIGINLEAPEDRIKCVDDATAYRKKSVEQLKKRVSFLYSEYKQPVSIIGWSMGGLYAADLAQALPDKIKMAITLGAPFGDPRGTAMFKLMRKISRSTIPIEDQDFDTWLDMRKVKNNKAPIKVMYSPRDGIVGIPTAKMNDHKLVEYIEIDSSHVGFALNASVYKTIAECLAS